MVEDCNKGKRVRDDSGELDENLPESKVSRVESDSDHNSSESRLTRTDSGESSDDSESNGLPRVEMDSTRLDSPGAMEIQDDLLDILDESVNVAERDPTMQGLDSVIKSFEEEIHATALDAVEPNPVHESCDLRHLLEASDDELGLPPAVTPPSKEDEPVIEGFNRVGPDGIDLSGFLGFEDDLQQYEALGYGTGVFVEYGGDDDGAGGFVTLDGLFDHAEPGDMLWWSESLHAM